ncbi:MAG: glycosyltransferase family 2 protein [Gammaproteobacteria bacterium]|nr:glycosyltransferase family 2 protein [Gammaproteobacteria bacterium]
MKGVSKQASITDCRELVGVVLIGRNEGERLLVALSSVVHSRVRAAIYVDSGSTDGSVELAESMGFQVHRLSVDEPFSAARARREGVEVLLREAPDIAFIQFVDGDCELAPDWIDEACKPLLLHDDVAIVCGRLAEAHPEVSIYNYLSDLQWRAPVGDIAACGGIFLIRRSVYQQVGGFNPKLVTREERDLCSRVLARGQRVIRIDCMMAWHDAGLLRFSQWWCRAVWGGYGDAVLIGEREGPLLAAHRRRIGRYVGWLVVVPSAILIGLLASWWWWVGFLIIPILGVLTYVLQGATTARWRLRVGDTLREAIIYAVMRFLRRFASAYGFVRYFLGRGRRSGRPDPHRARAGVK